VAAPDPADGPARQQPGRSAGAAGAVSHRAATVAQLAAAIARIGPDGESARPSGRDPLGDSDTDGAHHSRRSRDRPSAPRGRRTPPPDDPAGPAGDDPGDPEAVAKTICLRLLTVRARSRAELADQLRRREVPADVADRVLDRYVEVGLIDDAAFAQAYVASKHRGRGLGRAALRTELRRKGIAGPVAERAVQTLDEDAERDRAAELVAKKLDSAIFAGVPAARRRLLGMLARRGYPPSVAASVVNEALRGYAEPIALDPVDQADGGAGASW